MRARTSPLRSRISPRRGGMGTTAIRFLSARSEKPS
ncbi:Uncharacterised protein [Bordetella pertussis]|nr:Uncharacterised protein [Bordetella pertussis]